MVIETVVRKEKVSWRKRTLVLLYWGSGTLIALVLAILHVTRVQEVIGGSALLGLGLLKGVHIGRNKEWLGKDNPRESV